MKFELIMTICSILANDCTPPVSDNVLYNTHYECAISGYNKSIDVLNDFTEEKVNKAKIIVSFGCVEITAS